MGDPRGGRGRSCVWREESDKNRRVLFAAAGGFPCLEFPLLGILGSEPQVSGALAVAQPCGKDRAGIPGVSRVASGRARARPGPDADVCRERLAGVSRCPQPENVTVCHRCYLQSVAVTQVACPHPKVSTGRQVSAWDGPAGVPGWMGTGKWLCRCPGAPWSRLHPRRESRPNGGGSARNAAAASLLSAE